MTKLWCNMGSKCSQMWRDGRDLFSALCARKAHLSRVECCVADSGEKVGECCRAEPLNRRDKPLISPLKPTGPVCASLTLRVCAAAKRVNSRCTDIVTYPRLCEGENDCHNDERQPYFIGRRQGPYAGSRLGRWGRPAGPARADPFSSHAVRLEHDSLKGKGEPRCDLFRIKTGTCHLLVAQCKVRVIRSREASQCYTEVRQAVCCTLLATAVK
jgi:hypothetical protein